MITKLTSELKPGDVVIREGFRRTIVSARPAVEQGEPLLWDVQYERFKYPTATGTWAAMSDEWTLDEPSNLDLAVQRAQELADQWFNTRDGVNGREISEMFDLFRAAR